MLLSDVRLLLYNESEVGSNVGLGYRLHSGWLDCTFGTFLYYDNRHTGSHGFEQLSVGLEALGPTCDLRANVYIPSMFSDRKPLPDGFAGHYLLLDRAEVALTGLDVELGVPLPAWRYVEPRLVLGAYHYEGPGAPSFWGGRARIEARVTDTLSMDLSIHADPVFDVTVSCGVAWRFPAIRSRRGCSPVHSRRSVCERLRMPVERLRNVAVYCDEDTVARNPDTGDPIFFLHVARGGNSDGSFEDPYATLADALADPRYLNGEADVIYVRQDPAVPLVHTGYVSLEPDTQLLSNGPFQWIETQFGARVLPFSGFDPTLVNLPRIVRSVFVHRDNTTLSGFDIRGDKDGFWITLDVDGTNITIANNRVSGNGAGGVFLKVDGTLRMIGNHVTGASANGMFFSQSTADCLIMNNTVSGNGNSGILFNDSTGVASIIGNRINGNGRAGIDIGTSGSSLVADITGNEICDNGHSGIKMSLSPFRGRITGNTCSGNGRSGISLSRSQFTVDITGNTMNGNSGSGIYIVHSRVAGDIAGNTLSDNADCGIYIANSGESSFIGVLNNNLFGNNGGGASEFCACNSQGGTLYLELDGNSSTNTVPGGYNYDLYYTNGAFFLDEGVNVGTVGNSRGTFPDPWVP